MKAARGNRWRHRDATMLLTAYTHGLRASELVDLRWEIEFGTASLHVRRSSRATQAPIRSSGTSCARPAAAQA